jgi:hypothetical protein
MVTSRMSLAVNAFLGHQAIDGEQHRLHACRGGVGLEADAQDLPALAEAVGEIGELRLAV